MMGHENQLDRRVLGMEIEQSPVSAEAGFAAVERSDRWGFVTLDGKPLIVAPALRRHAAGFIPTSDTRTVAAESFITLGALKLRNEVITESGQSAAPGASHVPSTVRCRMRLSTQVRL